jgi:hypothetical protein
MIATIENIKSIYQNLLTFRFRSNTDETNCLVHIENQWLTSEIWWIGRKVSSVCPLQFFNNILFNPPVTDTLRVFRYITHDFTVLIRLWNSFSFWLNWFRLVLKNKKEILWSLKSGCNVKRKNTRSHYIELCLITLANFQRNIHILIRFIWRCGAVHLRKRNQHLLDWLNVDKEKKTKEIAGLQSLWNVTDVKLE